MVVVPTPIPTTCQPPVSYGNFSPLQKCDEKHLPAGGKGTRLGPRPREGRRVTENTHTSKVEDR